MFFCQVINVTIGNRIKEERTKNDLTQEEFGKIGGVSTKTQGFYERGERHPDAEYLERVSEVVDVSYVVTGKRSVDAMQAMETVVKLAEAFDLSELPKEKVTEMCNYVYESGASFKDMQASFKVAGVRERREKYNKES